MSAHDAAMTRMAQREISRRFLDNTRLDVKVSHGVVRIQGSVGRLRGYEVNLKHELDVINRILRSRPGIRDVIIDVLFMDDVL